MRDEFKVVRVDEDSFANLHTPQPISKLMEYNGPAKRRGGLLPDMTVLAIVGSSLLFYSPNF